MIDGEEFSIQHSCFSEGACHRAKSGATGLRMIAQGVHCTCGVIAPFAPDNPAEERAGPFPNQVSPTPQISNLTHPFRAHFACTRAAFAADDHPSDTGKVQFSDGRYQRLNGQ